MRLSLALVVMVIASTSGAALPATNPSNLGNLEQSHRWSFDHGGVIRGESARKELALIFTGGDFGEGTEHILNVLRDQKIKASFFFTGDFVRKPEYVPLVKRAIAEGHYVGPHSDRHPLYCPWYDRAKSLVSEEDFRRDLQKNIDDLRSLGALSDIGQSVYFIPPYEWFNGDQVVWAKKINVLLFNFTPGSGSNRDWAPEGHKSFVPSEKIIADILAYEQKDPHGLNGFILLMHVGSQRKDKTFLSLADLLNELKRHGYGFVRIDELLTTKEEK